MPPLTEERSVQMNLALPQQKSCIAQNCTYMRKGVAINGCRNAVKQHQSARGRYRVTAARITTSMVQRVNRTRNMETHAATARVTAISVPSIVRFMRHSSFWHVCFHLSGSSPKTCFERNPLVMASGTNWHICKGNCCNGI